MQGLRDPGVYSLRFIGRFRLKGKTQPVGVYEVLDALPEEQRVRRLATRHYLEEGQALLREGAILEAIQRFEAAWLLDSEDLLLLCLARCRAHLVREPGWDGVIDLDTK